MPFPLPPPRVYPYLAVGFGDISPVTAAGRLVVVILIAVAFLTVPRETNRLVALLATQSVFGRQKYEPSPTTKHVIVCGAVGSVPSSGGAGPGGEPANSGTRQGLLRSTGGTSGIIAFVREFFNDDHGSSGRHLVILARGPPAPELTVVLAHPKHAVGITYLDGDVMTERDLARAAVADSSGVFILSNKLARDFDAEDSANILRALAVQRFAQQSAPQLFVQLLRPENRALFTMTMASVEQSDACSPGPPAGDTKQGPLAQIRRRSRTGSLTQPPLAKPGSIRFLGAGAAEDAADGGRVPCRDDTLSLCVQQMKASLLAKSCMCPGFATVLFNLVASDADDGSRPQFEAEDDSSSRPQGSNPGPNSWASTVDVLGDRRLEHGSTDERRASMMSHTGRVAPYSEPEVPAVGAATSSRRNLAAPSGWLEQYRQGASFEVYRIPLSAAFEGVRFEVAASLVMEELGIILFGLDIRPRELSSSRIILSPAGYPIPTTAEERVQGLVIAEDRERAALLSHEPAWLRRGNGSGVLRRRSRRASVTKPVVKTVGGTAAAGLMAARSSPAGSLTMSAQSRDGGRAGSLRFGRPRRRSRVGEGLTGGGRSLPLDDGTPSGKLMARLAAASDEAASRPEQGRPVAPSAASHNPTRRPSSTPAPPPPRLSSIASEALPEPRSGPRPPPQASAGSAAWDSKDATPAPPPVSDGDMLSRSDRGSSVQWHGSELQASDRAQATDGDTDSAVGLTKGLAGRRLDISRRTIRRRRIQATMTNTPSRTLSEAVLASFADIPPAKGPPQPHVVVLCRGQPGDLFDFVRPLRGSHLFSFPDIVILCPVLPTADDWLKISAYPGVWVVVGSPMRAADLARAGTTAARCAVLFQQEGGAVSQSDTLQSDTLIDADAIVIYRLVRSIAPATEIVVELARLESVAFLNDEIADVSGRGDSMTERKAFAAGHVFTSSFVDVCLCQAFFNPHIIGIVEQLLGVGDRAAARAWHRNRSVVSRLGKPLPSHVYIMKVPRIMAGKKFSEVFRLLCASRGILPLGLRRHRTRHLVRGASAAGEPTSAAMQRLARQSDSDDDACSSDDSNDASSSVGSRTALGYASAQSTPPLRAAASSADQGSQHAGRGDSRPPSAAFFKAPLNALDAGSAFVVTNPPATTVLKASDSLFVLAAHSPELETGQADE